MRHLSKHTSFSIDENKSGVCCWSGSGSFSTLQIAWRSWSGEIFFSTLVFLHFCVVLVVICVAWSSDTKNTADTTLFSTNYNTINLSISDTVTYKLTKDFQMLLFGLQFSIKPLVWTGQLFQQFAYSEFHLFRIICKITSWIKSKSLRL